MKLSSGFICLLLIFLTLGIYYPSIFAPFNSVDDQLMVQQLLNQEHFSLKRHFAPGGTYDYFRPLVTLTFEIDKYAGGLQESFMHLVNILMHTLNVLLVFLLARRFSVFVGREGDLLPFLAAVLFSIHPLNSEAVNWIAGRADMFAGTFVFLSLICVLSALERRRLVWGIAGAAFLFCGSLCKETALFLLPGIFFLLIWRSNLPVQTWRNRWLILAFCVVAVLGYFSLRWGAFKTDRGLVHTAKFISQIATNKQPASPVTAVQKVTALDALRTVLKTSGFYAVKLFQPFPLNFAIVRINWYYLLPGIMLTFLMPYLMVRRRPVGIFFILSAFLGCAALMVVFTRLAWTPIAERYMYIPCGLFSLALVFGLANVVERLRWQKVVPVIAIPLFVASAWATVERNIVWQDNLTLFQDTVRKSPDFDPAKNELAVALQAHGRLAEADTVLASKRKTSNAPSSLNNAIRLMDGKRYDEARKMLLERLKTPESPEIDILELLVKITGEMVAKETDEARKRLLFTQMIGWLERLEKLTHNSFHWYRLGRVHLFMKNRAEAQRCFAEAAKRMPKDSIYYAPAAKLAHDLAQ